MRALLLAMTMLVGRPGIAETDIVAACYKAAKRRRTRIPEYKACLARAADNADAALNQPTR